VGAKPTRQLSLQPVAIEAVMEVTKSSKPSGGQPLGLTYLTAPHLDSTLPRLRREKKEGLAMAFHRRYDASRYDR
jgi:hypothetical protein